MCRVTHLPFFMRYLVYRLVPALTRGLGFRHNIYSLQRSGRWDACGVGTARCGLFLLFPSPFTSRHPGPHQYLFEEESALSKSNNISLEMNVHVMVICDLIRSVMLFSSWVQRWRKIQTNCSGVPKTENVPVMVICRLIRSVIYFRNWMQCWFTIHTDC